jgi:DNA-binding CsgD family transcriptional regulator
VNTFFRVWTTGCGEGIVAREMTAVELSYVASEMPDRATYLASVSAYLHHAIAGDVVGWNAVDADPPHVEGWMDPRQSDEWDRLVTATIEVNPLINSYFQAPNDVAPRRMSDCVSDRELRSSRLYRELFAPIGANYQLSIIVGRLSASAGKAWAINRSGRDFTDNDLDTARRLQPMLALLDRAYQPHPVALGAAGRDEARCRAGLTLRELDVLELLSQGLSAQQIASLRRIARGTVRKHLQNLYDKLDCHDRVLAVNKARALGLL